LLPAAVLLVYLCTVISGGMHHHDCGAAAFSAGSPANTDESQVNSPLAPNQGESDDCMICIALHQAKPAPAVMSLPEFFVPVGEAVVPPFPAIAAAFPLVKQARAPPIL